MGEETIVLLSGTCEQAEDFLKGELVEVKNPCGDTQMGIAWGLNPRIH